MRTPNDTAAPMVPARRHLWISVLWCAVLLLGVALEPQAGDLAISVIDQEGKPLAQAVVFATPLTGRPAPSDSLAARENSGSLPRVVTIAQANQQFVPLVTVIEVGTAVSFPNRDNVLHNVYSFSPAKKFQLPLYKDKIPAPVLFDQPGGVILGCNIHDWMVAYVYVSGTPYFAITGSGGPAALKGLPSDGYEVTVQHPRKRRGGSSPARRVQISEEETGHLELVVALKPRWRPRAAVGVRARE